MQTFILQNYLLDIANQVTATTTVEDIFDQLLMLLDIEESEKQIENGLVYTHEQVKQESLAWLK